MPRWVRTATRLGRLCAALAAGAVALLALAASASGASFAANLGSLGAIPDGAVGCGYGANRDVTFAVSGVAGPVQNVAVSMTLSPSHTWGADLSVVLIAPGGSPSQVVFERTGAGSPTGVGDGSDVAGPYTFSDTAPASPTWWQAAASVDNSTTIPSGSYRPSTPGESATGGANTEFGPTFAAATPNGTWTLRFRDKCSPDTGSVVAATLFLNEGVVPPDTDPPETTITTHPKDRTKKKTANFQFTSSEPGSSFQCMLDDNFGFVPCASPLALKVGKGKHSFQVRAVDASGNVDGSPASDHWKVKKKKKRK